MRKLRAAPQIRTQSGAVLAFALIFLIVLTVIAVTNMETTIIEERMAGNLQDYNLAFQAAETALEVAEGWLADQILLPATSTDGSTVVWLNSGLDPDSDYDEWWDERSKTWWDSNADTTTGLTGVDEQPQYIIEEHFSSVQGQSLNLGTGDPGNQRIYHRITARGIGGSANTEVKLQATFVRPYD